MDSVHIANWDCHGAGRGAGSAGGVQPSLPSILILRMVATVAPPPSVANSKDSDLGAAMPRQGQSPSSRAIQRATEKRPASHPNTLHL